MENAFAWLGKFFEYLGAFIPRPCLIHWNFRAVRYRRGKEPTLVEPGLVWFWPITTTLKAINVTLRAQEFFPTVYTTKDGKSCALGYTMVYTVDDPVLADSSCDDYESTIGELAESILSPIIASHTLDVLLGMISRSPKRGSVDAMLSHKARLMTRAYGVNVLYCRVHTFSAVRVIKLLQNTR